MPVDQVQDFFLKYWEFGRLHVIVLGGLFVVLALVFRRAAMALAMVGFGLFLSIIVYLMQDYAQLGWNFEQSLGVVIGGALGVSAVVYYLIFVRT